MSDNKSNALSSLPGYGLLAVVVAVLIGVSPTRKPEVPKGEAKSGTSGTTAAVEEKKPEEKKPADGYLRFLREKGIVAGDDAAPVGKVRFLILTLPDPIDSQLGYWYDQSIDATTRAMSDLGPDERYSLIDWWFPWTVVNEDRSKNLITRAGSHRAEPGVMIYQKGNSPDERRVVLVVGENPLSGIAVESLTAALNLAGKAAEGKGKPIPLVGPFCTGSQVSLGRTVAEWVRKNRPESPAPVVDCVTGSALGLKPWNEIWPGPEGKELERLCGGIRGTQAPLRQLRRVMHHYLSRPGRVDPIELTEGRPEGLVAYLVEANSGFGDAARVVAHDQIGKDESRDADRVVFRFPMHVGRLAGMRSKEARERDQQLGLIQPGEGQLRATDANRTGGDLIPSADDTRTALINQRMLADYWSQLRRERAKYVWVMATDRRDVLFLLEQVRAECPDARPIVFGADLHYAHPDYLKFMRGVLIVGTYPLFPPAQQWQAPSGDLRRMPFPSSNAQGVYNAVLAVLGSPNRMVDYRPPFGAAGTPPPIWVTTVGENGEFVPLAYSTGYHRESDPPFLVLPGDASVPMPPDVPFERPFFYLVWVVALAVVYAALQVWAVNRRTALALRTVEGRVWVPGLRAQYVTLVGIGALFAVLPLVLTFWSVAPTAPTAPTALTAQIRFYASVAALALVAGGTGWYVRRQARLTSAGVAAGPPVPAYAVLAPWQVVAFAILVGGAVVGWLLADHSRLSDAARRLFVERAADLYTGCSPVVPATVIAVGLLVHGLMGLRHVRLMNEFRIPAPYPPWGVPPPAGVAPPSGVVPQDAVAVGRIHAAAGEIEARSLTLLGVFTDPGQRTGTRWARLLVWGLTGAFAVALIYHAVLGAKVRDPILYALGVGAATTAATACVVLLRFVWRHEGRVPVARPRPTGLLLLVIAGAACAIALARAQRTWESHAWNCLFATGLLTLAFLTLVSGYRLFLMWKQVEKITRSIAVVPMVSAFDRFPDKVSRVFGAYLLSDRSRTLDLAIPLYLLAQLRAAAEANGDADAQAALQVVPEGPPAGLGEGEEMEGAGAAALCRVAANLVAVLAPGWACRGLPGAFGTVPEVGKEAPVPNPDDWRTPAEQFVAIMAVIFLSQYFARMRCLAYMAAAPAGALLVAVTAYQFEPERFLMYTAVGFAGAVIALMIWLLYRINRNELVSRVSRSTPNRFQLDGAFVQNLAVFVMPLAVLVATQLAGRMRSVVEPVLGWLR